MFKRLYEKLFVRKVVMDMVRAYRDGRLTVMDTSIYTDDFGRLRDYSKIKCKFNDRILIFNPDGQCRIYSECGEYVEASVEGFSYVFKIMYSDMLKRKAEQAAEARIEAEIRNKEVLNKVLGK